MGTKNKISLGVIISLILHHIRNTFDSKELYITKRKFELIKNKHPEEFLYIVNDNFQTILDNTIASCEYSKVGKIKNFISFVDGKYILYGISTNSYYTYLSTLFFASKKKLINCHSSIDFFKTEYKKEFEKFIMKEN